MAEYVVKLADERGRIQEQVQVAGSPEELRSRFTQAGYYVYSVRARGMRGGAAAARKPTWKPSSSSTSSFSP